MICVYWWQWFRMPGPDSRLSTNCPTKWSKNRRTQHTSVKQMHIHCVSVASPGLKLNMRVLRTDAPAPSNQARFAGAAKSINAVTQGLGISEWTEWNIVMYKERGVPNSAACQSTQWMRDLACLGRWQKDTWGLWQWHLIQSFARPKLTVRNYIQPKVPHCWKYF